MLITNQRIDKLAAAHTFFNSRGMLTNYPGSTVDLLGILSDQIMRQPQANHVNPGLSTQPVLERRQTPVDEHERYDARAEDNTEARAEIRLASTPGAHYSLYSTFFLPTLVRKLPQELNLLAQKIRQPDLPLLTHRFLFRVLNPDSPVPATANNLPKITEKIYVYSSAWVIYYVPSDISGLGGMHRERIRSVQSWYSGQPRRDCVFIGNSDSPDVPGFKGLLIARVYLCFLFE